MKNGKTITAELFPEKAPESVNNFIYLANTKKFYDGLLFHRCIPGFVIQGGCPNGNGTGGPGYSIKGEFEANGHVNDVHHEPGVLSMARASGFNTGGSQFFICIGDCGYLDKNYAGFGKVTEGLDVAMEIGASVTDFVDKPVVPQEIHEIRVETYGVDYPEPKKL